MPTPQQEIRNLQDGVPELPNIGWQAVCNHCDFTGTLFFSLLAVNQASTQALLHIDANPDHTATPQSVSIG